MLGERPARESHSSTTPLGRVRVRVRVRIRVRG